MNKLIILLLFTLPIQAQIIKKSSIRDFKNFSDYGLFIKYKDSLNKLNNTNYDYEFLADFKKIINTRDSLKVIENLKINDAKKLLIKNDSIAKEKIKREYYEKTKYEQYIGEYELTPFKYKNSNTYSGIMLVKKESIFLTPYPNNKNGILLLHNYENDSYLNDGYFNLNSKYTKINSISFDKQRGIVFFSEYISSTNKSTYIFKYKKIK